MAERLGFYHMGVKRWQTLANSPFPCGYEADMAVTVLQVNPLSVLGAALGVTFQFLA
jgi:hypothetical protein